jgi:hypothetical protein
MNLAKTERVKTPITGSLAWIGLRNQEQTPGYGRSVSLFSKGRAMELRFELLVIQVLLLLMLASLPCMATYSGLVVIPTADVLADGEYCIEPQIDDTFGGDGEQVRILNTQFGLASRLEAGVDYDLSEDVDTRVFLNAKYLLLPGTQKSPAVAVGVCGIGEDVRSSSYVVGTQEIAPSSRVHLGVMRIEGKNRWFVGADYAVSEKLTLMADYTYGDENCSSVGFDYAVSDKVSIFGGILIPNESDEDTGFTLHLVVSGP